MTAAATGQVRESAFGRSLKASFIRVTSFLTRSIRQESRLLSHHLMRGGLVLAVLFFFLLQLGTASMFGAAGARFVSMILTCCYWFLTLVGGLYFSVSITEEKEEETLPLIRMTGVSNFGLLIGKSLPRLAVVILFLLVVMPFLVLSITMGGVVLEQLAASVLGLLCYSFLLCQMGTFASTIAAGNRRAFSLMTIFWFLFELGYLLFYVTSFICQQRLPDNPAFAEFFSWLGTEARQLTLMATLSDSQSLNRGDDIWNRQMSFQLAAGIGFFLLSWLSFEFFNKRVIAQGVSQESPNRVLDLFRSTRGTHRVRGDALFWKSWQFLGGGLPWLLVRLLMIPLLVGIVAAFIHFGFDERVEAEAVVATGMIISGLIFILDAARQFGMVLNQEIYRQTMSSLLMLPLSPYQIAARLTLGVVPNILPSLLWFFGGWMSLFLVLPMNDWDSILRAMFEPWVMHFATWILLTIHLGVALSTFLRYGGMVLATAFMWIAAPICFAIMMSIVGFLLVGSSGGAEEALFRFLIPYSLMVLELVLCGLLQKLTVRRIIDVGGH